MNVAGKEDASFYTKLTLFLMSQCHKLQKRRSTNTLRRDNNSGSTFTTVTCGSM